MMLVLPMAFVVLLGLALTFRTQPQLFWGIVIGLAVAAGAFALNLARLGAQTGSHPGIPDLIDPMVSGLVFLIGAFAALAYSLFGILMRAYSRLNWHPLVLHGFALGLAGVMVVSFLIADR